MKCSDVELVAGPRKLVTAGTCPETGDLFDLARGAVSARNPFGVEQHEIAGSGDRHVLAHPEDATSYVRRVYGELESARIGDVARRWDRIRPCSRFRAAVLGVGLGGNCWGEDRGGLQGRQQARLGASANSFERGNSSP